jgi:hypothetical protein
MEGITTTPLFFKIIFLILILTKKLMGIFYKLTVLQYIPHLVHLDIPPPLLRAGNAYVYIYK